MEQDGIMIAGLLVAFAWAIAALLFDAINTNKGLRAGIAVEGNWLITHISGTNTPALWQILTIDGGVRIIILAASFIPGPSDYPHTFAALGIGAFIAAGFKNIQGGRQWKWMFSHHGERIPTQGSAWSQFWGFWG